MGGEYTAPVSTAMDLGKAPPAGSRVLALDTASPVVSVAVGRGGQVLASRSIELRRSSERLLSLIDEALAEAGTRFSELGAVVALSGPGSFTGLRVGLATVLGFHQATGIPVAALPTLPVLALAAGIESAKVWAAVDAIRGEWFAQPFELVPGAAASPLAPPAIRSSADLLAERPAAIVGFGVTRLAPDFAGLLVEPRELASAALRFVELSPPTWDPAALCHPLYLREPEASLPARPSHLPHRAVPV